MTLRQISTDELVEHATFLFGAQWRDALAAELGISRRSLVISLASGEQISEDMTLSVIRLLERKLGEMEQEQGRLRDRISTLRNGEAAHTLHLMQPMGHLQHAC